MNSKQRKIELLERIRRGEPINDVLKEHDIGMDAIFFSAKNRESDLENQVKEFEQKYPGRSYVVFKLSKDPEKLD